jgi:hypothetical protein
VGILGIEESIVYFLKPNFSQYIAVAWLVTAGCSSVEIIGYRLTASDDKETNPIMTDNEPESSETEAPADTEMPLETETQSDTEVPPDTGADSNATIDSDSTAAWFPMVFDFNSGENGFNKSSGSKWNWNQTEGTFDLDVLFTSSPSWQTIELYAGAGIWPGGVDWTGATSVDYRYRTITSSGGFFRGFFQSIEQESLESEIWLWYAEDQDLVPDGEWRTLTLNLLLPDFINLREVTKVGLQIHGVEMLPTPGDTDTQVILPTPEHVVVQVDSIIVRGDN